MVKINKYLIVYFFRGWVSTLASLDLFVRMYFSSVPVLVLKQYQASYKNSND